VLLATDYPFLSIMWTLIVFFAWVIWFWLLITVFADVFRRHDISGWVKAVWVLFVIVLPYIGVLIYLITQSREMAERQAQQARASQTQVDQYIKSVAASGSPAAEIDKAKQLLDSGSITQAEFDEIKRRALSPA
jgi:uncharacterized membrane protein YcjF (UPF0283 family)